MNRPEVKIEFIGGPFDGHRQTILAPPDSNCSTLALPVNENVFRMLEGKRTGPARRSRTVAVYELQGDMARQYRFIGTRPAVEFGLCNWKV